MGIGDFARATHLTIKTLRHYHRIGLLEPAEIDPDSGYRRYDADQVGQALVIGRFRALDMSLEDIREVLDAPDVQTRNAVITAHLQGLEASLDRTRGAVESLRALLAEDVAAAEVRMVTAPQTTAAAITATIDFEGGSAGPWLRGAIAELGAALVAQGLAATGPAGGIYADEVFTEGVGEATVFIPCDGTFEPSGRARPLAVPAAEVATITHAGSHQDIDRSYGTLATYVSEHALGIPGPIREYYLVGPEQASDERRWRTQIAWPIFRTAS